MTPEQDAEQALRRHQAAAAQESYRHTIRAWLETPEGRRRWWPAPEGVSGMDWEGCARMAAARQAAGVELSERDVEALRRAQLMPAESAGAA